MISSTGIDDFRTARFVALAETAITAVDSLWDVAGRTFWRDTAQRDADRTAAKLFPTVTCRCTEELLAAQGPVVTVHPAESRLEDMLERVARVSPTLLRRESDLGYEAFTLATALASCAAIARSNRRSATAAAKNTDRLALALVRIMSSPDTGVSHPFVLFHATRALQSAQDYLADPAPAAELIILLRDSVRHAARELLARHHMGMLTPAEHVVLAFCAATLSATGRPDDQKFALAATHAAIAAQDEGGSWPLGRVVQIEPGRLEISTYEVAWAVTATISALLELDACDPSSAQVQRCVAAIMRAGHFAERSVTALADGTRGWASDHPYERPRVESWTSAIVLQFAIAADDLRQEMLSRTAMQTFSVLRPWDNDWPEWIRWTTLSNTGEPTHEVPVYDYLQRHVVNKILAHPEQLPSAQGLSASVLLFGPPGTSKTTIAKAIAQRLNWPIVMLSPGAFIERGLEAIESEARSIFERLQELRRVVVLFDECDELFRDRSPEKQVEGVRTISAFVTASMLPKLQELHDSGRVLFFICTNHVRAIDPAVLRGGRVDHRVAVGPADERARRAILAELPTMGRSAAFVAAALDALAEHADRFSRNELKRAGEALLRTGVRTRAASKAAQAIVVKMQDSLTITSAIYDDFLEDVKQYSDPHVERAVNA